jgi:hypothetical protein
MLTGREVNVPSPIANGDRQLPGQEHVSRMDIRKIVQVEEEILMDVGQPVLMPARCVAAAAVIPNPWAGKGFVADLAPQVASLGPGLARVLAERLVRAFGGADGIEAFGKAAVVGLDGETEHGSAFIHTPFFGDVFRHVVQGTSIIAFSESRSSAGEPLTVPIWHKTQSATRSHYQTMQVRVSDAPRPDEIVIIAAASAGPRPSARIGDRSTDPAFDVSSMEGSR